jgi:hypothetical protein
MSIATSNASVGKPVTVSGAVVGDAGEPVRVTGPAAPGMLGATGTTMTVPPASLSVSAVASTTGPPMSVAARVSLSVNA